MTEQEELKLRALKEHIAARLRPVCQGWSDAEFDAMVNRLAQLTIKYQGVSTVGSYDRRATDRLLDDLRAALERSEAARHIRKNPQEGEGR